MLHYDSHFHSGIFTFQRFEGREWDAYLFDLFYKHHCTVLPLKSPICHDSMAPCKKMVIEDMYLLITFNAENKTFCEHSFPGLSGHNLDERRHQQSVGVTSTGQV